MWSGGPGGVLYAAQPGPAVAMGGMQAAAYIRDLGDMAQAQKRQAMDLLARSEWAAAMQAQAQQQ